ncbi:MAG: hypothetical protein WC371_01715 [Parachlamydiales bacterium]|jgi:pre-rRNA-processing protein TSR3
MPSFLPTIIWRHKKENLKKCTLSGLEGRPDLSFFSYPAALETLPALENYLILKLGEPPLEETDQQNGLFLIDATWRYAQIMEKKLPWEKMKKRSLPAGFRTAYPRKQTLCPDPLAGLASVEALFLAHLILKKTTAGLLDNYYWKEAFLKINGLKL